MRTSVFWLKTVFEALQPRLVPGSIVVFDELVNFPEYRAASENDPLLRHTLEQWLLV